MKNKIKMAYDLGMAAVRLGFMNIAESFARNKMASDGSIRYAGGSLVSLKQLEEQEPPDWSKTIRQWKHDQRLIKDGAHIVGRPSLVFPHRCNLDGS